MLSTPSSEDFPKYIEWLEKLPHKDPTRKLDLNLHEISENRRVGFINGIRTTGNEALNYGQYLSKMSGGYNIHIAYNETYNILSDVSRAKSELFGRYESKAVNILKNE